MYAFIIGHLDCYHILASVLSVVANIGVHLSFGVDVFVFRNRYQEVESPCHMEVLYGSYGRFTFSGYTDFHKTDISHQ